MDIRVIKQFRDAASWSVLHKEGDILSVSEVRGGELVVRGLAEIVAETPRGVPEAEDAAVEVSEKKAKRRKA